MRAYHIGVFGDSGSGKTTLLRELHETFAGLSIWINHSQEQGIAGAVAQGETALRNADTHRVNLRMKDGREAISMAREVAAEYAQDTGYPVQIITDEADDVLPADADESNPLRRGLQRDRDRRIKHVVSSQNPQNTRKEALSNARYFVWVGSPHTLHDGFLRYYNLSSLDYPREQFKYATIRMKHPPEIVAEGHTSERYA